MGVKPFHFTIVHSCTMYTHRNILSLLLTVGLFMSGSAQSTQGQPSDLENAQLEYNALLDRAYEGLDAERELFQSADNILNGMAVYSTMEQMNLLKAEWIDQRMVYVQDAIGSAMTQDEFEFLASRYETCADIQPNVKRFQHNVGTFLYNRGVVLVENMDYEAPEAELANQQAYVKDLFERASPYLEKAKELEASEE